MSSNRRALTACLWAVAVAAAAQFGQADGPWQISLPEQRHLQVRDPSKLPAVPIPPVPRPPTVSDRGTELPARYVSLDEAIRIALANSEVVRVLAGARAVSSGSTIYDPAIVNTLIDQERARFDPTVQLDNGWTRVDDPRALFLDPSDPTLGSRITGSVADDYAMDFGLSKTTTFGGRVDLGVNTDNSRFRPGIFPMTGSRL